MIEQPGKLVFPATAIVWASRQLSLGEKAIWYQVWALDRCICRGKLLCDCGRQGDRCYAGTAAIADRLGISTRTVEDARALLKHRGLLDSFARRDARNMGWVALMPIALPQAVSMDDAPQLREILDRHIAEVDGWRSRKAAGEPGRKPAHDDSGKGASQNPAADGLTTERGRDARVA